MQMSLSDKLLAIFIGDSAWAWLHRLLPLSQTHLIALPRDGTRVPTTAGGEERASRYRRTMVCLVQNGSCRDDFVFVEACIIVPGSNLVNLRLSLLPENLSVTVSEQVASIVCSPTLLRQALITIATAK